MAKSLCNLLMKANDVIVANFYVANLSFNAIRENEILAKIIEFTSTWQLLAVADSDTSVPVVDASCAGSFWLAVRPTGAMSGMLRPVKLTVTNCVGMMRKPLNVALPDRTTETEKTCNKLGQSEN